MTTLTTRDAALELNVTPKRVVQLIASGKLKATKAGRDWLIERRALDAVRVRTPGKPLLANPSKHALYQRERRKRARNEPS